MKLSMQFLDDTKQITLQPETKIERAMLDLLLDGEHDFQIVPSVELVTTVGGYLRDRDEHHHFHNNIERCAAIVMRPKAPEPMEAGEGFGCKLDEGAA